MTCLSVPGHRADGPLLCRAEGVAFARGDHQVSMVRSVIEFSMARAPRRSGRHTTPGFHESQGEIMHGHLDVSEYLDNG